MNRGPATLLSLALTLCGCLGRTLPLPPPSATIQSVTECPLLDCPMGGVIVTVGGSNAYAGADVTAYDDNVAPTSTGQQLGGVARASDVGAWQITIGPQHDVTGAVRVVQRGHRIRVYEVDAMGEASQSAYVLVPER